ncbi:MAG: dipeptidase [Planctomycetaceae bacterium]|jgi:succinyl-diaminopimelate desuccinylase|nr:dipeptidase [Planctomycetaceae bacterium]
MESINQYLEENSQRFENEFFDFLKIPSVSTIPSHASDVQKAAKWLANRLTQIGLQPEIVKTKRHPLVYAETPAVPNAPVVLIYGHFDVQPPDPLDLWISPPFEPTVRDGSVYARGATDDKGQLLTHVYAAEAVLKAVNPLPFQIKFLFEGEEEDGSESISEYVKAFKEKLACDCLIVSDCEMFAPGQPAIIYGLRGITAFELTLTGACRDLHSGVFGGAVYNPAVALCQMMNKIIDENGRVQIPDFYKDVVLISDRERKQFADLPFDEKEFFEKIGVEKGFGEKGFTSIEQRWARPTFDINGLTSGYQGEGSKTVLPSKASAKFTFRLVPKQNPEEIAKNVEQYLQSVCPPEIKMELEFQHGAGGLLASLDSEFVEMATVALEETFGCPPFFTREGGSIPIITEMSEVLDANVLLIGWGLDDDNLHAPNEKFSLAGFHRGIKASARLMKEIARRQKKGKKV